MMKFPNAAKGVKKIFTAEILMLIATIALVIGVVFGIFGYAAIAADPNNDTALAVGGGSTLVALVFLLAYVVLATIAYIMNLVGIINASHDETNFKSALLFLLIGIVTAILYGVFASMNNGTLLSLMYTLTSLMSLFVTIFVISGGVKLADVLNRGDVSAKGTNILKLIIVTKIIELILSLITTFMGGMFATVVAGVLAITAIVLSIVQYFMYLVFLAKAKKMLAEA